MEEDFIEFELNNEILNDFDSLMAVHLDQIRTLTITSISNNPKFYNIIGLCINLKTLKLKGDLKINTNSIISNICKPDLLEKIVFDGVRLPTLKSIQKFKNLKSITLNNIKYSSVKGFLGSVAKDNIEELIFNNTDFCRASISDIKVFKNLRILQISECVNCRFDDYSFLAENKFLSKVVLDSAFINFDQVSNLAKGKSTKIITAQLGKTTKKSLINKLIMNDENLDIIIHSEKLKELSENINFNRITNMLLIINKNADLIQYMKLLRRVKKEIIISIKDLSYLTIEDALLFKEQLNIKRIKINSTDENNYKNSDNFYNIDDYIEIRKHIDKITNFNISTETNTLEQIINAYKAILISDKGEILEPGNIQKNQLNSIIDNRYNDYSYAELLFNCLSCLNIEVKIIKGEDNNNNIRYWNQVKIYDYWYNVDLYLDVIDNLKLTKIEKRPKNFLIEDKEFYKTHKPKTNDKEFCVCEIDKKIINNYFKKEDKDNFEWLINIVNKIKKIFAFNKKEKTLALPASKENTDYTIEEANLLNEIDELEDE